MKKFSIALVALILSSFFPMIMAYASTTANPEVDTPRSPVNASKAIISGEAEPNAKIIVTGGTYQIAPVYADDDGRFAITVALVQEETNMFIVQAQITGEDPSDGVTVTIVESESQTAAYEESSGEDRTAPDAPDLDDSSVTTEKNNWGISGRGEEGTHVYIDNEDSGEIVENTGIFEVNVDLIGGGELETFSISLVDDAGNVSSGTKIRITSLADANANNEDEVEFEDTIGHWAHDYIEYLKDLGVVSGYSATKFGPDDPVTRAQLLKMALIAFSHDVNENTEDDFEDVDQEDWHHNYVETAYDLGIVEGYSDGTFRPDEYVTRAAAMKIILLAANISDFEGFSEDFDDVNDTDWYRNFVAFAFQNEFVSGYDDGKFHGERNLTRAQAAKIIRLVIAYLGE